MSNFFNFPEEDPRCQFVFKDRLCGYEGLETDCDKSLKQCKERFNDEHFSPGLSNFEISLIDRAKRICGYEGLKQCKERFNDDRAKRIREDEIPRPVRIPEEVKIEVLKEILPTAPKYKISLYYQGDFGVVTRSAVVGDLDSLIIYLRAYLEPSRRPGT